MRTLRVHGDLTLALAPALCGAVADALRERATDRDRSACREDADVVGLAALLQCGAAADRCGAAFSVVAEESLRDAALAARLV